MRFIGLLLIIMLILIGGCATEDPPSYSIFLVADGRERIWQVPEPITVQEFLEEIGVELGPLDRMQPDPWTQIEDGLRITIRRVTEVEDCENEEIAYETQISLFEGLEPGIEEIAQNGQNGVQEVCYRIRIEDGVEQPREEVRRTVIQSPRDEIIWVGPTGELEPIPINGTLAYISNNNAWVMRGSSRSRRPLTVEGNLDSRIFSLSPDGRKLLFARRTTSEDGLSGNQLWMITDVTLETPQIVQLPPQNVRYAEWVPGIEDTITYSTFEPQQVSPGWRALNDLWRIRVDPTTGEQISIEQILEASSTGLYSWWGTEFVWSNDGNRLAWVQANGLGLVNLEERRLSEPLIEYKELNPGITDWSWRASVSWSPDSDLIATVVHGAPVGDEPASNSPLFNAAIVAADGSFSADIIEQAGIWSEPRYSPEFAASESIYPQGYVAYLQARDWENSINGEYDLVVMDRDGSNARLIFPEDTRQRGLSAQKLVWAPDARQIAFIYLGNLYIINTDGGGLHQLTLDGGATQAVWVQ